MLFFVVVTIISVISIIWIKVVWEFMNTHPIMLGGWGRATRQTGSNLPENVI
jgi:hypothetical protein